MKLGQRVYYPQINLHGVTKTAVTRTGKVRILCDDNQLRWAMAKDLTGPRRQSNEEKQQRKIEALERALAAAERKLQRKREAEDDLPGRQLSDYVTEQPYEPDEDGKEEIQQAIAEMRAAKIAAGEVSAETVASRSGSYD